ncbi:MAG: hypothetical protein JST06_10475, partial [Bacteroidetes bacterium]|nr:hypothetical protein [Bacteroidota bacterium]
TFSGAALQAQVIPSSFFTETIVQGLTPQCPPTHCENIAVNCDMREDAGNGNLIGVSWSSDHSSNTNTWFQITDWAGGVQTLNIPGAIDPDLAFASGKLPSGNNGTQVLLVYRIDGTAYLDIYDLNNIGFGLTVTSALSATTPTPKAALHQLGRATSAPHIDAAYDPTFSPGNIRDMHEYACVWENSGQILFKNMDIMVSTFPAPTVAVSGNAHFCDIAFYISAGSGGSDRYIAIPYQNTATGNLELYELRMSTSTVTIRTLHTGVDAYAPRIAALDEWSRSVAPWEVAASVNTSPGSTPAVRQVFGYNLLSTPTPTDMSSLLSTLYGPTPAYQAMGACVAAGIGLANGPAGNVGNNQYTLGFYSWQHDSNYARHISPATGNLLNLTQCYQVNDNSSPVDYHWDLNVSMAVSNCSNTGRDILTAWYNGTTSSISLAHPMPCNSAKPSHGAWPERLRNQPTA